MTALVIALLWAAATPRWRQRLLLLGVAVFVLGGLIIARSRAQWLAGVIGLVVAGALAPSKTRRTLVPTLGLGVASGAIAGVLLLGERLTLFAIGLARRFTSISSSFGQDISLLNRYLETDAAWAEVLKSPVIGYGWGAPVRRYDVISDITHVWGFLHNGYVWILHKAGLLGLVAFMTALTGIAVQGALLARSAAAPPLERSLAAGGAGTIVAYFALALPANPFVILDQMLIVTLALALTSGVAARGRAEAQNAPLAAAPTAPEA